MAVPLWVRPGVKCVCIDDKWTDIFDIGSPGPFPVARERYTIAGSDQLDGVCFLILADGHVAPDLYAAVAFRPLTPCEAVDDMLAALLERAPAPGLADMEPA